MKKQILEYFANMKSGQALLLSKTKNPELVKQVAKEFIDSGGLLSISGDWSVIKKDRPIPKSGGIEIYFDFLFPNKEI